MQTAHIAMEDYFSPGFKTKPAVHIGSQTMRLYLNDPKEQAVEGMHLAAASKGDVIVARNIDKSYSDYWNSLLGPLEVINIKDETYKDFLSKVILGNQQIIQNIKNKIVSGSKLMVYFATEHERQLADALGIPLHGAPKINELYGTKSGIRILAREVNLAMPPGFICHTQNDVKKAINALGSHFKYIILKHDLSSGGRWSKKLQTDAIFDIKTALNEIAGGEYIEGRDVVVVEGWLKSRASLCAHIEIVEEQDPIICAGWEQIIDKDGITYMGAKPLMLSAKLMQSFHTELKKLAMVLKQKGAVGSYAPDFIVTAEDEKNCARDTCILIELNARVPITAFPLEIIKQVKGTIGNGFCACQINLTHPLSFIQIADILQKGNLLITKRDSKAKGVVPYNIGHLPWKQFNLVAIGDSWEEAEYIMNKATHMFNTSA